MGIDRKIPALPALTGTMDGSELLEIVQGPINKKVTVMKLLERAWSSAIDVQAVYGIVPNTDVDFTAQIAAAEAGAIATGRALRFPQGYIRGHWVLKGQVEYLGAGMGSGGTILRAPVGFTGDEIVALGEGPIIDMAFDGFTIDAEALDAWCMRLKAVTDGTHGGMWYSTLSRFDVRGGKGGVWLQGGNPTDGTPHQFCIVERLLVSGRDEGDDWMGLRITGQVGQFDWDVLEVTGNGTTDLDIFIGREENDAGAVVSDEAPYAMHFTQPTIQNSVGGIYVERAEDIHLVTAYFEGVQRCTDSNQSASNVCLTNPIYRNSGYNVAGTGFVMGVRGTSHAKITGAHWASGTEGSPDKVIDRTGPGWCDQDASNHWGPGHSSAAGFIFPNVAATIDMGFANFQGLIGGATTVTTLTNNIPEGVVLYVWAAAGTVKLGEGGNMTIPAGTLLTMAEGCISTWMRLGTGLSLVNTGVGGVIS